MLRCNKRADRSRCREDAAGNGHGYPLRPMLREQVRRHDRGCDRGNWPMPSGSQFRRPTSGAKLAGAVTQRTVVLRRFHVSARGAVGSGKFLVCQAASWRSVAILNRPSSTAARTVATQWSFPGRPSHTLLLGHARVGDFIHTSLPHAMLRSEAWNGSASRNRSVRRRCLPNSAVDQRSSTIAWRWRDETSRRSDKQPRRPYGAFQTVRHRPLGDSRSRSDAVAAQFSNRRFQTPPDAGAPGHRPVQNAGDVLADRGADQTRKRRFAIAKDRHGSAGSPSLFPKRLAQRRQRRDHTLRRKSKASRRFPSDFNLAKSDVDVSRLIAMSGSNVSSDHHHYLGREIEVRLGCWRHHGLEIGSNTMRSIPLT